MTQISHDKIECKDTVSPAEPFMRHGFRDVVY